MCLLYPKEPAYFTPLYLSKLPSIAMWRLASETIQSISPHRATRNTPLLHHSILTTYYHTDTMLTSSLFPWCILSHCLWCGVGLLCGVKFRKDRVKIQIWGKPAIFFGLVLFWLRNSYVKDTTPRYIFAFRESLGTRLWETHVHVFDRFCYLGNVGLSSWWKH